MWPEHPSLREMSSTGAIAEAESKAAGRDQRQRDRNADDLPARAVRPAFVRRNLGFEFDSLRRDLERPRQDERGRKSECDHGHKSFHDPRRRFERRQKNRGGLDQQPRRHGIGDGNLVDIAPLQLGEEVGRFHELKMKQSVREGITVQTGPLAFHQRIVGFELREHGEIAIG